MTTPAAKLAAPEPASTATRILDAGEALFAERGFAGVSVREIAARVGLNQASIYNHFPSKQALYEAVLERGFRPIRDLLASRARGVLTLETGDRLLEDLVEQLWSTPNLPKLVQREILDNGEYLERLAENWLKPVYDQGRKAMEITPGRSTWNDQDMPLLIVAMYHLLFGHFISAALMERVIGIDPFAEGMRKAHVEFLKRATHRLLKTDY